MENKLPAGWVETIVDEVAFMLRGVSYSKTDEKKEIFDDSCLIIRGGNIQDGKILFETEDNVFVPKKIVTAKQFLKKGDIVIVGSTGSKKLLGKAAQAKKDFSEVSFGAFLKMLRPNPLTDSSFLGYYFQTDFYKETMSIKGGGININNLRDIHLLELPIQLPPLAEQKRIVSELDAVFTHVHAAQAELAKMPALIKMFRQKVLAMAVSGELTRDFRAKSELTEWKKCFLETGFEKGNIFDGPFGSNLKSTDYTESGVQVIRLENIGCMSFNESKKTYISEEKYKTLTRHEVFEGDVIFSSFIAEAVRTTILPVLEGKAIAKADCFTLRPKLNVLLPKFLMFLLSSNQTLEKLVTEIHGSTRPRINTTQLKKLEIDLPPLAEQAEIVKRISELFTWCDAMESAYKDGIANLKILPQSLLQRAFSGTMLPQNAGDEPASKLLERVQAAKTLPQSAKKQIKIHF